MIELERHPSRVSFELSSSPLNCACLAFLTVCDSASRWSGGAVSVWMGMPVPPSRMAVTEKRAGQAHKGHRRPCGEDAGPAFSQGAASHAARSPGIPRPGIYGAGTVGPCIHPRAYVILSEPPCGGVEGSLSPRLVMHRSFDSLRSLRMTAGGVGGMRPTCPAGRGRMTASGPFLFGGSPGPMSACCPFFYLLSVIDKVHGLN